MRRLLSIRVCHNMACNSLSNMNLIRSSLFDGCLMEVVVGLPITGTLPFWFLYS